MNKASGNIPMNNGVLENLDGMEAGLEFKVEGLISDMVSGVQQATGDILNFDSEVYLSPLSNIVEHFSRGNHGNQAQRKQKITKAIQAHWRDNKDAYRYLPNVQRKMVVSVYQEYLGKTFGETVDDSASF